SEHAAQAHETAAAAHQAAEKANTAAQKSGSITDKIIAHAASEKAHELSKAAHEASKNAGVTGVKAGATARYAANSAHITSTQDRFSTAVNYQNIAAHADEKIASIYGSRNAQEKGSLMRIGERAMALLRRLGAMPDGSEKFKPGDKVKV